MLYYFQAGQGASPIRSAVEYISLAAPLMVGLLAGGEITTATGHYMPVTCCSTSLCGGGWLVDNNPNLYIRGSMGDLHGTD
jgi:hypothetical protein